MSRFAKAIFALAVFGLLGSAAVNAAPDLTGKSGRPASGQVGQGETTLAIKQVAPGIADLTFSGNEGVVLNRKPADAVFSEADKSGKGTAYVVPGSEFKGDYYALTGVGPAWAGYEGNKRFHLKLMYKAPMNEANVTLRMEVPKGSFGTIFAVVPVITDHEGRLKAWGSHPAGPTRHIISRKDGTHDMLTVLTVTSDGTIRPATADEVTAYARVYTSYF